MTNEELYGLLSFEETLESVNIKAELSLGSDAAFIMADLHYPNGFTMTIPFVYYLGNDWIFTPMDWQGWLPSERDEIDRITWRVNDTETEAVMMNGLPVLAPWVPDPRDVNREMRKHIGESLKKGRENVGMSIRDLADKTGISKSLICRIESGRYNSTIDTINTLAQVLGLKLSLI